MMHGVLSVLPLQNVTHYVVHDPRNPEVLVTLLKTLKISKQRNIKG
jgi:hypothetical protein